MSPTLFSTWILILTLGLMQWYSLVRHHFSGRDQLMYNVAKLQKQLERQKLRTALAQYEINEFKQNVAHLLPQVNVERSYPLRSLASVVIVPDFDALRIESASSLMAKAKESFRVSDFERSNELFADVVHRYPDSVHIAEAYFLLAEGMYSMKEYEECVEIIEVMMNLFPENDLTGFALLRLGLIMTMEERWEDAAEIYRTVKRTYKNHVLVRQAEQLLKEITL